MEMCFGDLGRANAGAGQFKAILAAEIIKSAGNGLESRRPIFRGFEKRTLAGSLSIGL